MRPRARLLAVLTILALMSVTAAALDLDGFITKGKDSPFKRIFLLFTNEWVLLFLLISFGWSLFYLMYRLGLERSKQVPPSYQHKLAAILSFISITPLLWYFRQTPDATAALKAFFTGWPGFLIAIMTEILVGALVYYTLSGWWQGWWSGGGGGTPP